VNLRILVPCEAGVPDFALHFGPLERLDDPVPGVVAIRIVVVDALVKRMKAYGYV